MKCGFFEETIGRWTLVTSRFFNVFGYTALLVILAAQGNAEEPWGKDAGFITRCKEQSTNGSSPAVFLILFHQQFLSEADGPRSHFYPSSSEYTRQAINAWGTGMGFLLGCDRLMRENSDEWLYKKAKFRSGYLKLDPVPQ